MADVSSTAISAALEEGTDPVGLLPKVVAAYARVHGLYWRAADPPQGPERHGRRQELRVHVVDVRLDLDKCVG